MKQMLLRWWRRWFPEPEPPIQSLTLDPPCSECGTPASYVRLYEMSDGWRLSFHGIAGGTGGADPLSAEEAQKIIDALRPPYETERIRAAGFYDDFGFCIDCQKFYCETHWNVSPTGCGTCPAGHSKSLDPHWHPDWSDLD